MSGHTPGPWEACEPGDYGDFDGESRVVCGDDMRIAVVHWHPRLNTEMSDANACLIAAAPDLLKALKGMCGLIQLFLNRDDLTDGLRESLMNNYRIAAAKAAIAKAREVKP